MCSSPFCTVIWRLWLQWMLMTSHWEGYKSRCSIVNCPFGNYNVSTSMWDVVLMKHSCRHGKHHKYQAGVGKCPNASHHPTIEDIISNGYLKVMFKILKKEHLPTPDRYWHTSYSKMTNHSHNDSRLGIWNSHYTEISWDGLMGFNDGFKWWLEWDVNHWMGLSWDSRHQYGGFLTWGYP